MLSQKFPFTYFKRMLTPRNIFAGRKPYSWWQIPTIIIFLNSLILMPVSLYYASLPTYQLDRIVDNGLAAVTNETYKAFQQGSISEGKFSGRSQKLETDIAKVYILPTENQLKELSRANKYTISLTVDSLNFYYPDGQVIESFLSGNHDLERLDSKNAVVNFLNTQWYASHRAEVFIYLILVYGVLIYLGSGLIILAGGVVLYLSRKAGIFDLKSLKECMGLLLNCLGIPSLVAVLASGIGLIDNPVLVMNIQVLGAILMLMLVLYRTGFRDR